MTTIAPDRVDEIVAGWLSNPDALDWDTPSGPLFLSGYAEGDMTMTGGGGGDGSSTMTGCAMCTGSWCNGQGTLCM